MQKEQQHVQRCARVGLRARAGRVVRLRGVWVWERVRGHTKLALCAVEEGDPGHLCNGVRPAGGKPILEPQYTGATEAKSGPSPESGSRDD